MDLDEEFAMDRDIEEARIETKIETLKEVKQLWEDCEEAGEFGERFFVLLVKNGLV